MRKARLPIDLVSGASFGAVVGAYYCAMPNGGLRGMLGNLQRLGMAINLAPLSSAIGGAYIAHALDYARIEELPVRFFPVATNICTGEREVIARGPIGFGVRASGAFPGIFTPATMPGKRYVDGGIADNVPADVLSARGADLVVASNIVPLPPVRAAGKPFFRGRVGRLLFEFDLIDRTIDAVRSPFVLFHKAGELQALTTAKVVFKSRSSMTQYFFWDLDSAQQVMAEAAHAIEEGRVIQRIERAWRELCTPMHLRR
jgi:predicted acylesterase/phospholipase RssA